MQVVHNFAGLSDLIIFAVLNICQNMRIIMIRTRVISHIHGLNRQLLATCIRCTGHFTLGVGFSLETCLFRVCLYWRQTFTTLFSLSLRLDIFWWSVTFYKSFAFCKGFCLIRRRDTKCLARVWLGAGPLVLGPLISHLIGRHLDLFLFPLRSPWLSRGIDNIAQVLHVRFWNRV